MTLANGQQVTVSTDAGVPDVLPAGLELTLRFDAYVQPPYASEAAALDGANARQAGNPFHLRLEALDCATRLSPPLPEVLLDYPVSVRLPVLPSSAPAVAPGTQFAWLRALWDADTFVGYLRIDTPYDAATNSLVFSAQMADVQSEPPRLWWRLGLLGRRPRGGGGVMVVD